MADKSRLDQELWPSHIHELREFRWGVIYELIYSGRPSLLIVEQGNVYGTLYEYSDLDEYESECLKVLNFGDGPAGAGIPAPVRPNPPTLIDAISIPAPAPAT